jgi:uncharacterized membrane protein YphA (DoxX/SURF4 family)
MPRLSSFLITLALRVTLAGLFIFSGSVKAADPTAFLLRLREFDLIPDPAPGIVALVLPWLEIFSGAGLLFRRLQAGASLIIALLLLLFSGAIVSAKFRGLEIHCACLGPVPLANLPLHVLLNTALLAAAIVCLRDPSAEKSPSEKAATEFSAR